MRQIYRYLIVMLWLTLGSGTYAHAQNAAPLPKSLLWEISGKELKQPSYLFGTIHAICPENFVLTETVKTKMALTERLSLEVDMDAPNFMIELQQATVLPEGTSLRGFFEEQDYNRLHNYFMQTMSLDLTQLDRMKPFMLHSMLLSQLTECQAISYEESLIKLAQQQGKEVIGLETVGEQLNAIDQMPASVQISMLTKMVNNMDDARKTYQEMVKLYLQQDLGGLEALSREEYNDEDYHVYEQAFLVNRNKRWIPVMEREARIQPTFFAVGAGHLTGESGLLELLRKRGYTVVPVQ